MSNILNLARAPRSGELKPRLKSRLGPDGRAWLQAELTRRTAAWAVDAASLIWLAFTPSRARAQIAALIPGVLARVRSFDTPADALALLANPRCPPAVRAALKPDPAVAA